MIDKITLEELMEEVYADQLDILKDSDRSAKEKQEYKVKIKENIFEVETLDDLYNGLRSLGYSDSEINEYLLSFFVES